MLITSFLTADRIYPASDRVLLEVLLPEIYIPGIFIPPEAEPRYPALAKVIRGGSQEGLKPGDVVLLHDEGQHVPRSYYSVFKLILNDNGTPRELIVDNEVEPVFQEYMGKYYANPSTDDYQLSVEDLSTGEKWSFNCSDVLDWSWDDLAHPTYRLEYIPTFMIFLWNRILEKHTLHYLAHVSSILCILRR